MAGGASLRVCPSCGSENAAGAKFCPECGRPLGGASPKVEERKVVTVVCFVVEGRVTLLYGDSELVLTRAHCVSYVGAIPHAFRNDSDSAAELIAFTTKSCW